MYDLQAMQRHIQHAGSIEASTLPPGSIGLNTACRQYRPLQYTACMQNMPLHCLQIVQVSTLPAGNIGLYTACRQQSPILPGCSRCLYIACRQYRPLYCLHAVCIQASTLHVCRQYRQKSLNYFNYLYIPKIV